MNMKQNKKTGKLVGVCNCKCHCGLKECFVNHDNICTHCKIKTEGLEPIEKISLDLINEPKIHLILLYKINQIIDRLNFLMDNRR